MISVYDDNMRTIAANRESTPIVNSPQIDQFIFKLEAINAANAAHKSVIPSTTPFHSCLLAIASEKVNNL